jgi:hypothetical protein
VSIRVFCYFLNIPTDFRDYCPQIYDNGRFIVRTVQFLGRGVSSTHDVLEIKGISVFRFLKRDRILWN